MASKHKAGRNGNGRREPTRGGSSGVAGRGGQSPAEPPLKDQIAQSGETEADPLRKAVGDDKVDRKYLGREFLTWLVFHGDPDHGAGEFRTADGDRFVVIPGERILLRALGEAGDEIAARGAAPAQTPDVRYAIAGGLTVREADLIITRGEKTWQLALNAEVFDVKRAKLPDLLSEEDAQRALERLELIDELEALLRTAFAGFLEERLQAAWQDEQVPRIREWLARSILEKEQPRSLARAA